MEGRRLVLPLPDGGSSVQPESVDYGFWTHMFVASIVEQRVILSVSVNKYLSL